MKISNTFYVLVLSILLTGCGFKFIYNHLDWWVNWYLDDYVVLNKQQQASFDDAFKQLHTWHRQTQLPIYIEQLKIIKLQMDEGITKAEINQHLVQMKVHWQSLRTYSKDELIRLTNLLSAEQRQSLTKAIQENIEERIEDHDDLSHEKWLKERNKQQEKSFKEWFGKLSGTQKNKLEQLSGGYKPTFSYWIDYRQRWLAQFTEALSKENSYDVYQNTFELLILHPDELRGEQYLAISENNTQIFIDSLFMLSQTLTSKQRTKFTRRIDNIIEDITELMNEPV